MPTTRLDVDELAELGMILLHSPQIGLRFRPGAAQRAEAGDTIIAVERSQTKEQVFQCYLALKKSGAITVNIGRQKFYRFLDALAPLQTQQKGALDDLYVQDFLSVRCCGRFRCPHSLVVCVEVLWLCFATCAVSWPVSAVAAQLLYLWTSRSVLTNWLTTSR